MNAGCENGAMTTREASCSCGQLRVTTEGEPIRVSICHCLACQRRTGSAFGVQARFHPDNVRIEGRHTEYTRISDDGEPRTFSFCPDCGSTVFYGLDVEADMIAIPVGAFADPSFPAPIRSIYESRQHAWVALPRDIDHYD
jgi:hypothetical protein